MVRARNAHIAKEPAIRGLFGGSSRPPSYASDCGLRTYGERLNMFARASRITSAAGFLRLYTSSRRSRRT